MTAEQPLRRRRNQRMLQYAMRSATDPHKSTYSTVFNNLFENIFNNNKKIIQLMHKEKRKRAISQSISSLGFIFALIYRILLITQAVASFPFQ